MPVVALPVVPDWKGHGGGALGIRRGTGFKRGARGFASVQPLAPSQLFALGRNVLFFGIGFFLIGNGGRDRGAEVPRKRFRNRRRFR